MERFSKKQHFACNEVSLFTPPAGISFEISIESFQTVFLLFQRFGKQITHTLSSVLIRLFHTPALYKHIHKKHHEWIAPISIAASYAHPLEHLVSEKFFSSTHCCESRSHVRMLFNFKPQFLGPKGIKDLRKLLVTICIQ